MSNHHHRIHSYPSQDLPFSFPWEGKRSTFVLNHEELDRELDYMPKKEGLRSTQARPPLPLPPCPVAVRDRRWRKEDDPFLKALIECTKKSSDQKKKKKKSSDDGLGFSCKGATSSLRGVREDVMIRLPRLRSFV